MIFQRYIGEIRSLKLTASSPLKIGASKMIHFRTWGNRSIFRNELLVLGSVTAPFPKGKDRVPVINVQVQGDSFRRKLQVQ